MSRPYGFWGMSYGDQMRIRSSENRQSQTSGELQHWRKAYEDLVKQTGRDLNDGLGLDPRVVKRREG